MLGILVPVQYQPSQGRQWEWQAHVILTLAGSGITGAGMTPFVCPLDLFAFMHTLGNCEGFMRARTNNASQGEVPGGAMFFPIWEVCILSFSLQMLYISLAFWGFFCSVKKAYFEF